MEACDDRIGELVDLADGALDDARRTALEAHVAACAGCRDELAGLASIGATLRATSTTVDDLHLSGFARRTSDAAVAFRDRSARGLFWSLTRGVRLALAGSFGAMAVAASLFVASLGAAPQAAQPPEITAESGASATDDDLAEASVSLDSAFDTLTDDDLDLLAEHLDDDAS